MSMLHYITTQRKHVDATTIGQTKIVMIELESLTVMITPFIGKTTEKGDVTTEITTDDDRLDAGFGTLTVSVMTNIQKIIF